MCLCAYRCSLCRVSHVNLLLFDFTYYLQYLLEPLGPWIINLLCAYCKHYILPAFSNFILSFAYAHVDLDFRFSDF